MLVYKILRAQEWATFEREQVFAGSPDDVRDGFVHLSTADQVAGTAAKYFAGDAGAVVADARRRERSATRCGGRRRAAVRCSRTSTGPLRRDEVVSVAPL